MQRTTRRALVLRLSGLSNKRAAKHDGHIYKQRQEEYKHRIGPKVRYNDLRVYLYECAQDVKDKKHRVQYG